MRLTGSVVVSFFATIWWIVGTSESDWPRVLAYGIPVVVTSVLMSVAWQRRVALTATSEQESKRHRRVVGIASGVEGAVILVAVNILGHAGKQHLAVPIIAIIVGLHFVPLARWLPVRLYYATAAALVGFGLTGLWISTPALRLMIVGSGAACALWSTSAVILIDRTRS